MKWLLDRCGTLLLRDVPGDSRDTLTSYKESMIRLREINASDCPPCVSSLLEGREITQENLSETENQCLNSFLDHLSEKEQMVRKPREKKEKPRPSTRFERLEAIRRQYPGCQMRLCQVDVNGDFQYENERYRVDSTCGKYAPHKTRYGDQYDMDRILLILLPDGGRAFADQDGYLLDAGMVTKIER